MARAAPHRVIEAEKVRGESETLSLAAPYITTQEGLVTRVTPKSRKIPG